jgi:hypothetical protein
MTVTPADQRPISEWSRLQRGEGTHTLRLLPRKTERRGQLAWFRSLGPEEGPATLPFKIRILVLLLLHSKKGLVPEQPGLCTAF